MTSERIYDEEEGVRAVRREGGEREVAMMDSGV